MSKRKSKFSWAIVMILVVAALIGAVAYLTNGFQSEIATFYVKYAGQTIVRDCTGLKVKSGEKFELGSVEGEVADYEVRIYASGTAATDFSFTIGGEEYSWYQDVVKNGWEFTDYFGVERNGSQFSFQTVGFSSVLQGRFPGREISWTGALPAEVFRLEITAGKSTLKIGFQPYVDITGVELPGELVI